MQRVSVRGAGDRVVSECGTQAGNVMVEGVPWSGRKLGTPEAVDEHVDPGHTTIPEGEHRQQGLTLRAADVRGPPVREHLE